MISEIKSAIGVICCIFVASALAAENVPMQLKVIPHNCQAKNGDTLKFSAAVYDRNRVDFLKNKDTASLDTCFQWRILHQLSDSNEIIFLDSTGPVLIILANGMYSTVKIECLFNLNSGYWKDTSTVIIYQQCCNFSLYIEGDCAKETSPLFPLEIQTVCFGAAMDTMHVYAIKRDRFGNYVEPYRRSEWSTDLEGVSVKKGEDSLGEALVYLENDLADGIGRLFCRNTLDNTGDSVLIIVERSVSAKLSPKYRSVTVTTAEKQYIDIYGRALNSAKVSGVIIEIDNARATIKGPLLHGTDQRTIR